MVAKQRMNHSNSLRRSDQYNEHEETEGGPFSPGRTETLKTICLRFLRFFREPALFVQTQNRSEKANVEELLRRGRRW